MEKKETVKGARRWEVFHKTGRGNIFPDENLLRLVRGKYVNANIPRSGRVLDVGFGLGGNLILFAQAGFEAHGLEVTEECIQFAERLAIQANVRLKLDLLKGTQLQYPSSYFDLLLSWNTVYYHETGSQVQAAIREFYRVLRPGGALLMSVIHPRSCMVRRLSNNLRDGMHRIDKKSPYDNRFGLKIFYDGTSSGWRKLLASFELVEEGYAESDLFVPDRRSAWRLFLARKGKTSK